jgi:hypothetical protein
MVLFVVAAVVAVAVLVVWRFSVRGINGRSLGWMSEQWLARHRMTSRR